MTIETITLCNITSISGEQIIDFTAEPLRSAGLFAITGDTGAGKSSVLDAICLALYGNAPRLETSDGTRKSELELAGVAHPDITPKDARGFLRRGEKQGYARVLFAAADGRRYEAHWAVRVNGNGKIERPTRALYEVSKKGEKTLVSSQVGEIKTAVERIIGLDYAQFSRTVILAQNAFATFLQARTEEKSALLEKLTGTDIYGKISQQIHRLSREAESEVVQLEAQQRGVSEWVLCEEELKATTDRLAHVTVTIADLQNRQKSIEGFQRWYAAYAQAQQQLTTTTTHHNEVNKRYLALSSEEQQLERYDSVQGFRKLFEQIRETRLRIESIKNDEMANAAALKEQKNKLHDSEKSLGIATERKADAETQWALRQPDVAKGYELEGERSNIKSSLEQSEMLLQVAQGKAEEKSMLLKTQQREEENLKKKYEELNLKLQSLEVHCDLFEQYHHVVDQLTRYNAATKQNAQLHATFEKDVLQQTSLTHLCDQTQKKLNNEADKLQGLRNSCAVHRQALEDLNPVDLHHRQSVAAQTLTRLKEADRQWKRIVEGYVKIADRHAHLERATRKIEQLRSEEGSVAKEEQRLYEKYQQLATAFTLSQVEKIKQLRQNLKEGQPCPVCGSAHHPYHTEVELELGETQSELEKNYHAALEAYEAKRQQLNELRNQIAQSVGKLESEREAFDMLKKQQLAYEDEWQTYANLDSSFKECTPSVNREGRATTISTLIDSNQRIYNDTQQLIVQFEYHTKGIKNLSEQIERSEANVADLKQDHATKEANLRLLKARIEVQRTTIEESDAQLAQLRRDLGEVCRLSGWKGDNIDVFIKQIGQMYSDWKKTKEEFAKTKSECAVIETGIAAAQKSLDDARNAEKECREHRDRLRKDLNSKNEELRQRFGNSSPAALAETLQKNVNDATNLYAKVTNECERLKLELRRLEGICDQQEKTRHQQEELVSQRTTELDLQVSRYNLQHAPLKSSELTAIFDDTRDWNALRATIAHCKHDLLLADQKRQEAESCFLAIKSDPARPTDREEDQPDALASAYNQLTAELNQFDEESNQLRHRLNLHNDSVAAGTKMAAQVERAKANASEWLRLNDIFGSHDGKRFRDMAQSFTFSILVEHANFHLRQLSDRYELRVLKGSLTLEVVDHDMLDETRFVTSLSGGETFIVSLAMALGLASLSSNSLRIGSLFIDEGFGNLDQESLAQVLSTLAALESTQGRKVGVVSHTEQIRSQILPQIRVKKLGNDGRSKIEVV